MEKALSAKNKAFWAKSKSEQRIAVAKDVIASIKSGFYKAETGTYFAVINLKKEIESPPIKLDKAISELKNKGASCEVCGIGGCFTSLIKLGNNAKTEDFLGASIDNYDGIHDDDMRVLLRKVFSSQQLTLIECAFERTTILEDKIGVRHKLKENAADFGCQYDSDKDRLLAIMQNIVHNNGTFKP